MASEPFEERHAVLRGVRHDEIEQDHADRRAVEELPLRRLDTLREPRAVAEPREGRRRDPQENRVVVDDEHVQPGRAPLRDPLSWPPRPPRRRHAVSPRAVS